MKMKNFKINSENITNIAARIVVAVGIIVLVVVAFKLAAFLLTKILFPLLGGVIQILFEATSWIIPLFLISRTKTFQKAYNAARGKHEEKENKNKYQHSLCPARLICLKRVGRFLLQNMRMAKK